MQPGDARPHAHLRPSVWAGRVALGRFVLTLSVNRKPGDDAPEPIHNRLTALRQEYHLTHEELAEQLQVHPSTLIAMEKDEYVPSLRLALRISTFFGLPIEAIFFSPALPADQAQGVPVVAATAPERWQEQALAEKEESNATGI